MEVLAKPPQNPPTNDRKEAHGLEVLAKLSGTTEQFSAIKVASEVEAAQERVVSSLMEVGVCHPEHDVPRTMTATLTYVINDVVPRHVKVAAIVLGTSRSG